MYDLSKEGLVCLALQGNWGFFLDNLSQCFTLNFKSYTKILLPPIPYFETLPQKLLKCVFITHNTLQQHLHTNQKKKKTDNLCTFFVFLKRKLYFLVCRPPFYTQWETIIFGRSWTCELCDAAPFFNGKGIYTLSTNGKLGIIEDLPQMSMCMRTLFLSPTPTDSIARYKKRQLVTCGNQLLLVQQKMGSPSVMEVWNVDLMTKQFKRIFDLDGIYIFLSREYSSAKYALASPAGYTRIPESCVYSTDDDNGHCISKRNNLYAFDLKDQSIFMSTQENIHLHNPYNSVPSVMPAYKPQQNARDNLKNESDDAGAGPLPERVPDNICSQLSLDLQKKLVQYLVIEDAHSYINFRSVCKLWRSIAPCLHWKVEMNSPFSGFVEDFVWLLTINKEDGLCTFYNPFTKLTCYMKNNDLVGCEIRYSKDGVLLVSRGARSLFFVEPFRKQIIQLPERSIDYCCDTMSFSASPSDSSDWVIFGIVSVDKYRVRISYLRAGDNSWTSLIRYNVVPFLLSCSSPVYFGGEFCVIGQDGNVGVFGFFPDGYCYWQIKQIAHLPQIRDPCCICRKFLVQCEQNLLYSVFISGHSPEYVRVYELNLVQNRVKFLKEFKPWLIFISEASSFFVRSLAGFEDDAVFFPKFSINGDYLHYSMKDTTFKAGKDECNDIYHRKELLGRVWIHNKYLVRHV